MKKISETYPLTINKAEEVVRADPGHGNLLLKLYCNEGLFFYKEIPEHSVGNQLNQIYSELCKANTKLFQMALPIKSKFNNYCEEINGKPSTIYPFIEHKIFPNFNLPIELVLSCLSEFHEQIQSLNIPEHPFKTYHNWFERGHMQLSKSIDRHPFLDDLLLFTNERFKELDFINGNIHFDLNPFNVWITDKHEIYFSDFDTVQVGALAKDLFDLTVKYVETSETAINIEKENFKKIFNFSKKYVSNATERDIRLLLLRPKMRDFFCEDKNLMARLDQMKKFIEL
jgi:hypothetical protein